MHFLDPYSALCIFLEMLRRGSKGKKEKERTVSKIAFLLERYYRGEPMTEAEHQLLTTSTELRNDLENILEIGGWLPPVDQKTLAALRRALGSHTPVAALNTRKAR
jgi:hypothetical protein